MSSCQSVRPSVRPFSTPSVSPFVYMAIRPSVRSVVRPYLHPSDSQSVTHNQSTNPSTHPSIRTSIRPFDLSVLPLIHSPSFAHLLARRSVRPFVRSFVPSLVRGGSLRPKNSELRNGNKARQNSTAWHGAYLALADVQEGRIPAMPPQTGEGKKRGGGREDGERWRKEKYGGREGNIRS